MGCVASKLEEEEEVVTICRERKNLMKLAVERRYALAEAHCKYYQSLFAVSAAIKVFVSRHSSPSSPFLITFPPSSTSTDDKAQNFITNPTFLHSGCEAIDNGCKSSSISTSEEEDEEDDEGEEVEEERVVERHGHENVHHHQPNGYYYYMQMPTNSSSMASSSPLRDQNDSFGWDFFNPFEGVNRAEIVGGFRRSSDEDDLRVVREEEGIPELEEAEEEDEEEHKGVVVGEKIEKVKESEKEEEEEEEEEKEECVINGVISKAEKDEDDDLNIKKKGLLQVIDTPSQGRELLEALKDIEDYFRKAHESGKDVSKMLEANMILMQSGLEDIQENSTKLIQNSIAWHRSISSKPSSCKSLVASSSKGSNSAWTEFKNDFFDDYGGMNSGSHSLTLGRIYAWEKKLYEEVKAGDTTRKLYEKKCSRLRNQDVKGDDEISVDKTKATVKDLYARILVAIRSAESISRRIEKLRDEELQPQIIELLKGLMRTWQIMLEAHETQNKILFEVKTFASPAFGKFCTNSHRLATLQIVAELHNWRACLVSYVSAQKSYVKALHGWLTKFIVPEVEFYSKSKGGSPLTCRVNGPPLLAICHDWLSSTEKLPEKSVSFALKSFARDVKSLWDQQGEEQQQKRKVDSMAKELDRRIVAFQKSESRFFETRLVVAAEQKELGSGDDCVVAISEKKDQLDSYRARLELEKEKHLDSMRETQRMTLSGFQSGFCRVFESLVEFSKASQNMYNDLVVYSENAEKVGNVSFIEDATKVGEKEEISTR